MNKILMHKFFLSVFFLSSFVLVFYTSTAQTKPISEWFKKSTTPSSLSSDFTDASVSAQSKSLSTIKPHILSLVYKAYDKTSKMGLLKKPLVTIVDYTIPSTQPRLWVVDLDKKKVIYHTLVAHGSGNGGNIPHQFSDKPGSRQASLGVFLTGKTYQGGHGLSLVLHGLEKGINGNAERRRIVVHGANYVNPVISNELGRLGRSFGCLALENHLARKIIQTIQDGSLVFSYYPDKIWLKNSKFL